MTQQFRQAGPCCVASEDGGEDKMGDEASACHNAVALLNKGLGKWTRFKCKYFVDINVILSTLKGKFENAP